MWTILLKQQRATKVVCKCLFYGIFIFNRLVLGSYFLDNELNEETLEKLKIRMVDCIGKSAAPQ